MANTGVPKGNTTKGLGAGFSNHGGMVNDLDESKVNALGVPYGQTPGLGGGNREVSMNELPSNAKVIASAKSNLMTGMSQNRGPGGAK